MTSARGIRCADEPQLQCLTETRNMEELETCPACERPLYPAVGLRPRPSLSQSARVILAIGFLTSAVIYIVGLAYLVAYYPGTTREKVIFGSLWFVVAAVPAYLIARRAYRIPKVLRHRCRICGWSTQVVFSDTRTTPPPAAPSAPVDSPQPPTGTV